MVKLSERVGTSDHSIDGVSYVVGVNITPKTSTSEATYFINLNKTGETKMGIRKVSLTLIDNDNNLKGAEKIVFEQSVVTEHDNDKTIQQVLITGDVSTALDAHNKKRESTVDKAVLRSTGTKVFLEPVEIFELQWQVVQIG
jgi:hypothetical protein